MKEISFPYGKGELTCNLCENELCAVLTSPIDSYTPEYTPESLVLQAIENPIGSKRLCELAIQNAG